MRRWCRVVLLGFFAVALVGPARASEPKRGALETAKSLLAVGDHLGFRVLVKRLYWKQITYGEWYRLKALINANARNVGFDLIYVWNLRNPNGKSNLDKTLEYADSLMLNGNFGQAFTEYQKAADHLRKLQQYLKGQPGPQAAERYQDSVAVFPFVLHSMGRALYGAGRFDEAIVVYSWLEPSYPRFRQVLFERMWAAFRAGRVEIALGAIASQRSAYFSSFLSPESYLIQTYIYRKLCRNEDLAQVLAEMKRYEEALKKETAPEGWAGSDLETRVLWGLSRSQKPKSSEKFPEISDPEREKEKAEIRNALDRAFQSQRAKILADLKSAMAYAHLAGVADTRQALKPVQKLTSRQELSHLDLESWPVDSAEEWVDEIGRHIFVGESLCAAK